MIGQENADSGSCMIGAMRRHVAARASDIFCRFLFEDQVDDISWEQLFSRAAGYARHLSDQGVGPKDVVLVVLRHRPDLMYAFLGAMLAGCIPAFLAPLSEKQDPEIFWANLGRLFINVGAAAAFIEPADLAATTRLTGSTSTKLLSPLDPIEPLIRFDWPEPKPDDIAFLQFSSGTTGLRKGVMLTHRIVMAQIETYRDVLDLQGSDRIASWLPLYHDMGLIACFIIPLVAGVPIVMIDAFEWVYRPVRLFQAIEDNRATLVWLPNFAFNHLCATVAPEPAYDLGSVRAFVNCSEPCKVDSIRRFTSRLAPMNVRAEQMQTCYAMAEAVFAVTQSELGRGPFVLRLDRDAFVTEHRVVPASDRGDPDDIELVSCGRLLPGFELRIIAPDGADLPADRVGEIAIRGPSLFSGYYRAPEASEEPFRVGWYLTGDLGFVFEQHLFVTGRSKDVIIVNGRNFYAHDIEACMSRVDGVKAGRAVAFAVENVLAGSEEALVVAETAWRPERYRDLAAAIKRMVARELGLTAVRAHPVPLQWLIKTSSGKIARGANRDKYLQERR
jgi:fatty-acyl-CoA synthase